MWSLHGSAASASSRRPTSRWRLESTLYHRRVLPPRLDKFPFHTPQPRTGQRQSRCSGMLPIRRRTAPHSERVGDSSSNTVVQWLSVSTRILQSHPAAALYDAVVRASGVVYRGVLEGGSGRVRLVNPCIRQKTDYPRRSSSEEWIRRDYWKSTIHQTRHFIHSAWSNTAQLSGRSVDVDSTPANPPNAKAAARHCFMLCTPSSPAPNCNREWVCLLSSV